MKITYYGHSCFAVDTGKFRLLFDPFITPNPLAASVDVDAIKADVILLSHAHQDHVADAAGIAERTGALVISNFEVVKWLESRGVKNTHAMNHGGNAAFDFGTVKMVNAIHSSSFPDGSYGGNPAGFVLETEGARFYYSGDTALTLDMQLVARGGHLDFAALCIGDNFTMGIEDAILAAQFVGAKKILGLHYDTFPPIRIDHAAALKTFGEAGLELSLPGIGETIDL